MKKKLLLILSMVFITLCCVFGVSAEPEIKSPLVEQRPYTENGEFKIVDNVVYKLYEDYRGYFGGKFYEVYDWFATPEAAKTATEINIVPEIDGIKVRAIKFDTSAADNFNNNKVEHNYSVKKVTIPDTILYIGIEFFTILDGVEELVIPSSLKDMGLMPNFHNIDNRHSTEACIGVFEEMENLKKVTFLGDIENLGGFQGCTKLEKVVIKGSVKNIISRAFYRCTSLKSFKIPDTVEKIGGMAFSGSGITSITIPASVKYLGNEDDGPVFKNCKKLTKVVFKDKKLNYFGIDFSTFQNCTSLKKVYLPKSVKTIYIYEDAFRNCKSLTKIYNADNIKKIYDNAFRGCKSLTSFTFSNKLELIGEKAFYNCTKLKNITVNNKKKAPKIGKKAFGKTAEGIKFTAKNSKAAKSWKTALKKSGLKKMKVRYVKYVNV